MKKGKLDKTDCILSFTVCERFTPNSFWERQPSAPHVRKMILIARIARHLG